MQSRFLSASWAVSFKGVRNSRLSGAVACFDPGPWQFSHWLPFRWGVAASERKPVLYSKPVVWQVTHSASKTVFGLGSFWRATNACACLVLDHFIKVLGWQHRHVSAPTNPAPA